MSEWVGIRKGDAKEADTKVLNKREIWRCCGLVAFNRSYSQESQQTNETLFKKVDNDLIARITTSNNTAHATTGRVRQETRDQSSLG